MQQLEQQRVAVQRVDDRRRSCRGLAGPGASPWSAAAGGSGRSWTGSRRRRATCRAGCRSASPVRRRSRCGRRRGPCRCRGSSAPSTSRSGRDTRVVNALALETVSTRCRSTVQVWTMSRGGRSRTAPTPGKACPTSRFGPAPRWSVTGVGPAASSTSRSLSASRGHGVRNSGADSASRLRVDADSGRPGGRRRRRDPQDQSRVAFRARVAGQHHLAARTRRRLRPAAGAPAGAAQPGPLRGNAFAAVRNPAST